MNLSCLCVWSHQMQFTSAGDVLPTSHYGGHAPFDDFQKISTWLFWLFISRNAFCPFVYIFSSLNSTFR